MNIFTTPLRIFQVLLVFHLWTGCASGLGWGYAQKRHRGLAAPSDRIPRFPNSFGDTVPVSDIYAHALRELQQLESEPLCHRIAARLLVTNCQLLDGKDEATVLTDSGIQIRDFVEAYAASLAICDLERGNFNIPAACSSFREPALSRVAVQDDISLHVSSSQIQACISGLKSPDSAWGTYISYRHKALQFCEAARADQEKTQNILLFQKLIKVTEQLVRGVEFDLQKRMNDLDQRTQQAAESLDRLNPKLNGLHESLRKIQVDQDSLQYALQASAGATRNGLDDATSLNQLLKVMMEAVLEHHSRVAATHEASVETYGSLATMAQRTSDEMGLLLTALSGAAASSFSLQQQIEISRLEAVELSERQTSIENGLIRLGNITEELASKYDDHSASLESVRDITHNLVETLTDANTLAFAAKNAFASWTSSWLSYVCFPVVFVLAGSYGLPPSLWRNIGLAALSEAVALLASCWGTWSKLHTSSVLVSLLGQAELNTEVGAL